LTNKWFPTADSVFRTPEPMEKVTASTGRGFASRLDDLKSRNLYRRCRVISGPQGPVVRLEGRRAILMCSNNYLGLAGHPALARAASRAAYSSGTGSGASRLVSGTMDIHRELEERLAAFKNAPACVLFNSGYQANVGVLGSIAGEGDVIYSDELNHASIIDGARLSRAAVRVYPHLDMAELERLMSRESAQGRKVIVTDGVFSMDGDLAPLPELVELKRRHDALLVVDEAHATGVIGPGGRGLAARYGLEADVDIIVGTLGKALGSFGAFAAGSEEIMDWLVNAARSFVYTTALPPPVAAASLAAVRLLEAEPERVEALKRAAGYLRDSLARKGLDVEPGEIPIIPLMVGDEETALAFASRLLDDGVFCTAIRPPSVPAGTSRLRMTVMATHEKEHLDYVVEKVFENAKSLGIPNK